ncbi:hypothetical protein HUW63_14845, partial [Myxococcus sp. AM001]|nr:hypothetical protein [Myxococcus sp. AM001]
ASKDSATWNHSCFSTDFDMLASVHGGGASLNAPHHVVGRTLTKGLLARMLPLCTVVKLSEEEIGFVTGTEVPDEALTRLAAMGVPLPVVTLGERGALLLWKGARIHVAAPRTRVVDTTGAGDGFVAGLLHGLVRWYGGAEGLRDATGAELAALASFACEVGARVVERLGAVEGLPRAEALARVMPSRPARPRA